MKRKGRPDDSYLIRESENYLKPWKRNKYQPPSGKGWTIDFLWLAELISNLKRRIKK